MAFGFAKQTPAPIAVDFGVGRLKVLQTTPGGTSGGPELLCVAACDVPLELADKPEQRLAFQVSALAGMMKSGPFRGKRAMCCVSSAHCFAQHVQVQKDGGKPIDQCIGDELRAATNREPATLITRHSEVCEVARAGNKRTEMICFAMPRESVVGHMKALRAAKLEPVGIHAEHTAMVKSLERLLAGGPAASAGEGGATAAAPGATIVIDLGLFATKVAICHGGKLGLARTIAVGTRQLDAPAKPDAARKADAGAGAGGAATAVLEAPVAVTSDLSMLSDEVSQCVRYYRALFPERAVDRAVFVGGGAMRTEVCRQVARGLRVPAQVADALASMPRASGFQSIGVEMSRPSPEWSVAVGLSGLPTDL